MKKGLNELSALTLMVSMSACVSLQPGSDIRQSRNDRVYNTHLASAEIERINTPRDRVGQRKQDHMRDVARVMTAQHQNRRSDQPFLRSFNTDLSDAIDHFFTDDIRGLKMCASARNSDYDEPGKPSVKIDEIYNSLAGNPRAQGNFMFGVMSCLSSDETGSVYFDRGRDLNYFDKTAKKSNRVYVSSIYSLDVTLRRGGMQDCADDWNAGYDRKGQGMIHNDEQLLKNEENLQSQRFPIACATKKFFQNIRAQKNRPCMDPYADIQLIFGGLKRRKEALDFCIKTVNKDRNDLLGTPSQYYSRVLENINESNLVRVKGVDDPRLADSVLEPAAKKRERANEWADTTKAADFKWNNHI